MNHILYNISLIVLIIGIILMTVYITKVSSFKYLTQEEILMMKYNQKLKNVYDIGDIYQYKVTNEYNKMFNQPSLWFGYQYFDPQDQTDKLYIKNT